MPGINNTHYLRIVRSDLVVDKAGDAAYKREVLRVCSMKSLGPMLNAASEVFGWCKAGAIAFCRYICSMTDLLRFNLNWLAGAISEARRPGKHFYYDTHTEQFFMVEASAKDQENHFYNMVGLEMSGPEYDDMVFRFLTYDEQTNGISELPRLTEAEKKELQWQFLTPYDGNQYHYEYYKAVEYQTDEEGFILDQVIQEDEDMGIFKALWENYKLNMVAHLIQCFAALEGFEINLLA